jgi:FkbM family methyltransferase
LRGAVSVDVHGVAVTVNAGYAYPAFSRRWRSYNQPLVDAVEHAAGRVEGGVTVVDVGAAIGDTVLLLIERCGRAVSRFHCVEGDDEFFGYLAANLGRRDDVVLHHALVSDHVGAVRSLVRTHPGTASAQGDGSVQATTLDQLLLDEAVDVVKVDTDGFDGRVLGGATVLLERYRPVVLFEWHPKLVAATGNDSRQPFDVLHSAGYRTFHWYTKFGDLAWTEGPPSEHTIGARAAECLEDRGPAPDWHYDILAFPDAGCASGAVAR